MRSDDWCFIPLLETDSTVKVLEAECESTAQPVRQQQEETAVLPGGGEN